MHVKFEEFTAHRSQEADFFYVFIVIYDIVVNCGEDSLCQFIGVDICLHVKDHYKYVIEQNQLRVDKEIDCHGKSCKTCALCTKDESYLLDYSQKNIRYFNVRNFPSPTGPDGGYCNYWKCNKCNSELSASDK